MSPTLLFVLPLLALAAALIAAGLWIRVRRRIARLEEQNTALRQQLETANAARESFFDLVTHELRSPLSAILGYQELLGDGAYGDLPERAAEPVVRIGRSARHLLHLIEGVVELSQIRSGTVRPDIEDVDLGVLFTALADGFRTAATERRVEPTVRIPDSLPTIRSDQDRLVRALDLAITSAVKHPGDSSITLDITLDDHGVIVRISGTALFPMDSDDLAHRVGIRLAVAHGIAAVLGGSLTFETDPEGVIRALTFRIPDLAHRPTPDL